MLCVFPEKLMWQLVRHLVKFFLLFCPMSQVCVYCNQIHAAFYSYIDGSVKDSKRCCRYKDCLIVFHTIVDSTPILVNMLTFWISNESKEKLQLLFIKHYLKNPKNGTVIKVHLSLMET